MEVVDGVSPVESINAAEDLLYVVEHVDPAVKAELQNVKSLHGANLPNQISPQEYKYIFFCFVKGWP